MVVFTVVAASLIWIVARNSRIETTHTQFASAQPFNRPKPPQPAPLRPEAAPLAGTPLVLAPWRVKPDPLLQKVIAEGGPDGMIPISNLNEIILYPTRPSEFAFVPQSEDGHNFFEVWNVGLPKKIGTLKIVGLLTGPRALSPDGKTFAAKTLDGKNEVIRIWSTATGQVLSDLRLDPFQSSNIAWLDFSSDNQLITTRYDGIEIVEVWYCDSGQKIRHFFVQSYGITRRNLALSNNGKYLAIEGTKSDRVCIYDVATGLLAGEAALPRELVCTHCEGLTFSPDGKSLAGLFDAQTSDQIVCWNIADGKVNANHRFSPTLRKLTDRITVGYNGPALEWLSDCSGWLVYGSVLLDAKGANMLQKISPLTNFDMTPRRLFGLSKIALVKESAPNLNVMVMETLSKDQLHAAAK